MADDLILGTLTTELQAVNTLITSMGEAPFASVDPSPSADVDKALAALNEANNDLQARGWNWNREYAYPLTLASDGTVPLPANTIEVTAAYYIPPVNGIGNQPLQIIDRGLQLYDQQNHTYVFTTAPFVDLILLLPWTFLPEAAKRVIVYQAVQKFQSRDQASSPALSVNAKDLKQAWITLEQHEDATARWNTINGNISVRTGLYGEGSMRRLRSGLN